jgi:hypothetical protein
VAGPAIVLIILLAGDAADPATQAVLPAARRPLGEDAVVLVQQTEALPSDDEALSLARNVHALSAVSLAWEDAAHSHVRLRVFLVEGSRRYDYELAFDPHDQAAERGRAIGLAMTPVLTRAIADSRPADTPAPPTPTAEPVPLPVVTTGPSPLPEARPAASTAIVPLAKTNVEETTPRPSAGAQDAWLGMDVASSASVGIGGNASGVGPTLGLRASVLGPIAIHAVGVARFGTLASASATSSTVGLGGGAAWRIVRWGPGAHAPSLGVRADLLAMEHTLAQTAGGATIRRSRWLTAVDLMVEGAWPLARHFGLSASVGAELAAGPTAVTVGGAPVDHIPVGRVVAELGVGIPF